MKKELICLTIAFVICSLILVIMSLILLSTGRNTPVVLPVPAVSPTALPSVYPSVDIINNFKFEKTFIGNNRWEVTATGELPTPCYNAHLEAFVAESYPEQVTVKLVINSAPMGQMCTQQTQPIEVNIEVNASAEAKFTYIVERSN